MQQEAGEEDFNTFRDIVNKGNKFLKKVVNENDKLKRNKVWCKKCGRSVLVNSYDCLQNGWPRCCGETMTIDSPEERSN